MLPAELQSSLQTGRLSPIQATARQLLYGIDIINGSGNGKFNPDGLLTRQEAAVIDKAIMRERYFTKCHFEHNHKKNGGTVVVQDLVSFRRIRQISFTRAVEGLCNIITTL